MNCGVVLTPNTDPCGFVSVVYNTFLKRVATGAGAALLVGIAFQAATPAPAFAWFCNELPPLAERIDASDAVFIGTIIHQEGYNVPDEPRRGINVFRVHKVFKGPVQELVTVASWNFEGRVGDTYLMYTYQHLRWKFATDPCWNTPVWPLIDEHEVLGGGQVPSGWSQFRTTPWAWWWVLLGEATFLCVGIGLVWWWRWKPPVAFNGPN